MKITNNLEYNNLTEIEREIINLLPKLDYIGTINGKVYKGLEAYANELYIAREKYDKKRLKQK